MARQIVCGWETQSAYESTTSYTAGASVSTSEHASGAACLAAAKAGTGAVYSRLQKYGTTDGKPANFNCAAGYVQIAIKYPSAPSAQVAIAYFRNTSSSIKASLRLNTDGTVQLYDLNGTSLKKSTNSVCDGVWHYLNVYVGTAAAGSGPWSFKLDNGDSASGSSATLSSTNHGFFDVGFPGAENVTITGYIDDVIFDDSAMPTYYSRIGIIKPDGDSATNTGYTASTGNKYSCVGQGPPPSVTQYISATGAAVYTATMQAASTVLQSSDTINCVVPIIFHSKHGSAGSDKLTIRSGSSPANTVLGTAAGDPTSGCLPVGQIYALEPVGSASWTTSLIDGLEVGATYATSTSGIDECYALIEYYRPATNTYEYAASGGATSGGDAGLVKEKVFLAGGGATSGGAAATLYCTLKTYAASGGATSGGAAATEHCVVRSYTASGGATSGGEATCSFSVGDAGTAYEYAASGGVTSGGAATLSKTKAFTAAGGATSGGAAGLEHKAEYAWQASGGATSGGAALTELYTAPVVYTYAASGGATSGGSAAVLWYLIREFHDIELAGDAFVWPYYAIEGEPEPAYELEGAEPTPCYTMTGEPEPVYEIEGLDPVPLERT